MAKLSDKEIDSETDRQVAAWRARYGHEPEAPYAEAIEFDHQRRLLILSMSDSHRVVLPLEDIQGLATASPTQLLECELLGRGTGLDWPSLGVSFNVHELIGGSYGNWFWMQELRRKGGAARTGRKQAASRANGSKGGRPRRSKTDAA